MQHSGSALPHARLTTARLSVHESIMEPEEPKQGAPLTPVRVAKKDGRWVGMPAMISVPYSKPDESPKPDEGDSEASATAASTSETPQNPPESEPTAKECPRGPPSKRGGRWVGMPPMTSVPYSKPDESPKPRQ